MPVIRTERNLVAAIPPLERDGWVETLIGGGDGITRRLSVLPIDHYDQAVEWAVSMADQFAHPIHIVPIDADDLSALYGERFQLGFEAMTPEERWELRRTVVTTCAEVMRDCPDREVRADAYDVLAKMRVVTG